MSRSGEVHGFNPDCLRILFNVPGHIVARLPGHRHEASEASRSPHHPHSVLGKHLVLGHESDVL
jgi:hypothetical protein